MKVTIDNRRTVLSWYIYDNIRDIHPDIILNDEIYELIQYAEDNLEECDRILAKEYEEYIPQF